MVCDLSPSGSVASLPLTSCVLPKPAPPTNMMGFLSAIIMSRKYMSEAVSEVGTNTDDIDVVAELNSTSCTSSVHGANLPVLLR